MPPIIEKYCKLFPTILFLCHDEIHSMHFVLSLKYMSETQQNSLVELMKHCGAEISLNVEDATDHSAVIVDHNDIVHFKGPAFTLNYLESCLEELKVHDISEFRQDVTKHIAKDVRCMDVIYFRSERWNSLLSEEDELWFQENISPSASNTSLDLSEPQATSSCMCFLRLVNSNLETEEHNDSHPKEILCQKTNKFSLSSDEDSDIEEDNNCHVNINKVCHREVDTQKNSTIVEQNPRNSKTIKEDKTLRRKTSVSKLKNDSSINLDNITRQVSRKQRGETNSTSPGPSSSMWTFVDDFQQGSSDEEVPYEVAEAKKEKNFFDFEAAKENLRNPNKDKKHSRLPYSYEEKSNILKYIIRRNEFSRVKGRELWMIMERRKICPNRTWQSMKEHFIKKIIYSLESFDFLSGMHKMKLKNVF